VYTFDAPRLVAAAGLRVVIMCMKVVAMVKRGNCASVVGGV
jgi:hypothetical protein